VIVDAHHPGHHAEEQSRASSNQQSSIGAVMTCAAFPIQGTSPLGVFPFPGPWLIMTDGA
jgi:hypothetical protein